MSENVNSIKKLAATLERLMELMQIGGRYLPSRTVVEMLLAMLYRSLKDNTSFEEGLTIEDITKAMEELFGPSSVKDRSRLSAYLNRLEEIGLVEVGSTRPLKYSIRRLIEDSSLLFRKVRENFEIAMKDIEEVYYQQLIELVGYSRLLSRPLLPSPSLYVHEVFLSEISKLKNCPRIMGIGLTPTTILWARSHMEIAGTPVEHLRSELVKLMTSKEHEVRLIYFTTLTDVLKHRLKKGDVEPQTVLARVLTLYEYLKDERLRGKLLVVDLDHESLANAMNVEPSWVLGEGRFYGMLALFAIDDKWRIDPKSVIVNTLLPGGKTEESLMIREGVVYREFEAYQKAIFALSVASSIVSPRLGPQGPHDSSPGNLPRLLKDIVSFAEEYTENVTVKRLKEQFSTLIESI